MIDDGDELTERTEDLEWLADRGRHRGFRMLAGVPNHVVQRAYSGWLVHLVRDRQALLLDPEATDGSSFNVRLPSRQTGAWPPGRGYVVCRGSLDLVQVARD